MRRFVKDSIGYAPTSLLPAVFSLFAIYYFTRLFLPDTYGLYSLALAVVAPLSTLAAEWIAQPAARYYAEYQATLQLDSYYRGLIFVLALITGLIGLICLGVWAVVSIFQFDISDEGLLLASMAWLVLQPIYLVGVRILPVHFKNKAYVVAVVGSAGLSTFSAIFLVHFVSQEIRWLMWGAAGSLLLLIPYIYWQFNLPAFLKSPIGIEGTVKMFWRYGSPFIFWFLATSLLSLSDRYVIQWFHGSAEVGIYSVNYGLIAQSIGLVNLPFMIAIFPVLTQQWAQKDYSGSQATLRRMTDLYGMLGIGLVGGTAVIGRPLVELLVGEAYWEGAAILVPVAAGLTVYGGAVIGQKSLELTERTRWMSVLALAAALANLILNVIFVPSFGFIAAAYTTLVSYFIYTLLIWWKSQDVLTWIIPWKDIALSCFLGLFAWGIVAYTTMFIQLSSLLTVLISGALFVGIYGSLLYLIRHDAIQEMWTS